MNHASKLHFADGRLPKRQLYSSIMLLLNFYKISPNTQINYTSSGQQAVCVLLLVIRLQQSALMQSAFESSLCKHIGYVNFRWTHHTCQNEFYICCFVYSMFALLRFRVVIYFFAIILLPSSVILLYSHAFATILTFEILVVIQLSKFPLQTLVAFAAY